MVRALSKAEKFAMAPSLSHAIMSHPRRKGRTLARVRCDVCRVALTANLGRVCNKCLAGASAPSLISYT